MLELSIGIFIILATGGFTFMTFMKQDNVSLRKDIKENVSNHLEVKRKLTEAKFAYEKAVLDLNLLEAQDEKLRAEIDDKMKNLGFFGRLPMLLKRR